MKSHTLTKLLFIPALALMSTGVYAQAVITTIGGTGTVGYSGDGGLATLANMADPQGVAVDHAGNVYIADRSNSVIRMISATTGNISTYAGNGVWGLAGMGGPATAASLRNPDAVFAAANGDLYLTDWWNDMAMSVDHTTGNIEARCGTGEQGGDGDSGSATLARMEIPGGIFTDGAGNIYIADYGNNRVRKVASTGIVYNFAGGAGYGYAGDGGPATAAMFASPNGIFGDKDNNIYVSDAGNNVIRKISAAGIISTVVGNGAAGYTGDGGLATSAQLSAPGALYIDNNKIMFIADKGNNVIRRVDLNTGTISTVAGNGTAGFSGDGGPAIAAELNGPSGIWQDYLGALYIADMGNARVRKVAPASDPTSITNTTAGVVSIFPDPSAGTFTLNTADSWNGATVEVFNVVGAKVYSNTITATQTNISLDQPSGMYVVSLHAATGNYTQKITISK